ncbi:MAG: EAL domain-containing protein [Campylobacterota bacterium]
MLEKTTYKKLIIKIILATLVISLLVAFIYAKFLKQETIKDLSRDDAKKTTKLVFQSLYSAMEKGWTRDDLENIIERINNIDKAMEIDVYRSELVSSQYGKIPYDKNNTLIKKAFTNEEVLNIIDDTSIDYYYPIATKQECLKCHSNAKVDDVLGVINVKYPINDLKVSMNSITNFFILFIIVFSLAIFIALFTKFDRYLVKPIKNFISNIDTISQNRDISQRIDVKNNIEEIDSMQKVFNKMLDSIEYQFYYDDLTNLPNRKKLIEVLDQEKNAVLLIIDVNKFREINDLYGEKVGDFVLKELSTLLKNNIAPSARLFKLHADEYAIHYPSVLNLNELDSLVAHINQIVENHTFKTKSFEISIHITAGIAYGKNLLLTNADIALSLAKKKKHRYLVYESTMQIEHEYEQNLKWTKKIKDAIKQNRVVPVFQPIVNTQTKKIVKYEALMRIEDENQDLISPAYFLELAKKNRLYTKLTKIMLEKSFKLLDKTTNIQVSINLSVDDILNQSVYETIMKLLNSYYIKNRVVFEIIESEGIENFEEVKIFIEKVKDMGAKISIDDFGTGYSNFEYLMKLNVDYIKIDASMIKDIDKNRNSQMVTETIVDFAKKMGMETVAEFIHSQNVYDMVKTMGIDYSQGYFLGEPKRLEDID